MIFNNLGLIEPILRAVEEKGYSTPSPIQLATIPVVLDGRDLMASAQTGTGKTAAFVLPMLQHLNGRQPVKGGCARVLIITPTRELAAQIQANIETYGKYLEVSSAVVFGGVNVNPQIKQLRRGVDILVATPGRLLDLFQQKAIRFDSIEALVLDEADRMLDMGYPRYQTDPVSPAEEEAIAVIFCNLLG
jgi:ATP-dependent RNA helicase RhlE